MKTSAMVENWPRTCSIRVKVPLVGSFSKGGIPSPRRRRPTAGAICCLTCYIELPAWRVVFLSNWGVPEKERKRYTSSQCSKSFKTTLKHATLNPVVRLFQICVENALAGRTEPRYSTQTDVITNTYAENWGSIFLGGAIF